MIGALIALVAAAGAFLLLGKTFMPTMDEGDLIMQLEKLPSISLDQTIAIDSRCSRRSCQGAGSEGHRRPRRLRRTRPRPDGPQPDRHLHGAQAARMAQPDKAWLADQLRQVMADFPGIGPPSPSPSTCASRKC
jgi:cobalt-zinc-cadmium resistance protein CzcA